jgi:hypothetical protein
MTDINKILKNKELLTILILQVKDIYPESYQLFIDAIEFNKIKDGFQGQKEEFERFMIDNYSDNLTKYKREKNSGHDFYLLYKKGSIVSIHDFFFFKHRTNYERIINLPNSDFSCYPTIDFLRKTAMTFFKCNHEHLFDKRCRCSYKPNVDRLIDEIIATATDMVVYG